MSESLRADRLKKIAKIREKGIDPYPAASFEKDAIKDVLGRKVGEPARIAGRVMLFRDMGKITFMHVQDESGRMQVVLNEKELKGEPGYKFWLKNLDLGDFIGVEGERFDTKKGEKSVLVKNLKLLAKAIRPLPDKHKALKNEELRLRRRYLDYIFNPEARDLVYKREKFWSSMRDFMKQKGFLEVETPVLETVPGGADANPFKTEHKALGIDVYLRISMGELWQKRLMVAGFEKTFEIGRQFRNEGMDPEHLQDYTQLEFYWAFADYQKGMKLVQEMYRHVAKETFGTLKFKIKDFEIDLGQEWKEYDYRETVKEMTGVDILKADLAEIERKLKELKVKYDKKGFNLGRAIDTLWKYCRKQISGPGFLVNEPLSVSPLAKKTKVNPELVERFHVLIAGSEVGNGYSELNDPLDQAERFREQQKMREAGDEEAQMHDQAFVEALEYGMPPTCGFGTSERLFSFLMDKTGRECQIFPLVKPSVTVKREISARADIVSEEEKSDELGLNYQQAEALLEENIKDPIIKMHCQETEAIMRELAKKMGEDKEKWGIIGLLHDIDWDQTKDNLEEHCVQSVDILRRAGASDFMIRTVISHGFANEQIPKYKDKKRTSKLEHCLAAAETLTGLVIASALVQPEKKLASVKLESLKKKFKDKGFARNCNREIIRECEQAGIELDELLELGLKALQARAADFNL